MFICKLVINTRYQFFMRSYVTIHTHIDKVDAKINDEKCGMK